MVAVDYKRGCICPRPGSGSILATRASLAFVSHAHQRPYRLSQAHSLHSRHCAPHTGAARSRMPAHSKPGLWGDQRV